MVCLSVNKGKVKDAVTRPIGGNIDTRLFSYDELVTYCKPYIEFDLENHPDYKRRFPIREFFRKRRRATGVSPR